MQADALHRRHEFVANRCVIHSTLPRIRSDWRCRRLCGQRLRKGKDNDGARQRFMLSRHALIMVECGSHEI